MSREVRPDLQEGEYVIGRAQFSVTWLCLPVWCSFTLFIPLGVLFDYASRSEWPIGFTSGIMLAFSIGGLLSTIRCFDACATQILITSHSIVHEKCLFSRRTHSIRREQLESIQIRQSLWGRLANFGTLQFVGSGSVQPPAIAGIYEPDRVRNLMIGSSPQPRPPILRFSVGNNTYEILGSEREEYSWRLSTDSEGQSEPPTTPIQFGYDLKDFVLSYMEVIGRIRSESTRKWIATAVFIGIPMLGCFGSLALIIHLSLGLLYGQYGTFTNWVEESGNLNNLLGCIQFLSYLYIMFSFLILCGRWQWCKGELFVSGPPLEAFSGGAGKASKI
jgi:hypothetical protein